jgi:hypothetical protein
LLNPLLAACRGLVFLVVGSEVCPRLKFLGANGDVAQKPATPFSRQKSATNGCEAVKKAAKSKALPTPCSTPCSLLAMPVGGLWGLVSSVFLVGSEAAESKANPLLNPLLTLCSPCAHPVLLSSHFGGKNNKLVVLEKSRPMW